MPFSYWFPLLLRFNLVRQAGGAGSQAFIKRRIFVRKSAGPQQAPTEGPQLEPSANAQQSAP
jgi:hypothetical protein